MQKALICLLQALAPALLASLNNEDPFLQKSELNNEDPLTLMLFLSKGFCKELETYNKKVSKIFTP